MQSMWCWTVCSIQSTNVSDIGGCCYLLFLVLLQRRILQCRLGRNAFGWIPMQQLGNQLLQLFASGLLLLLLLWLLVHTVSNRCGRFTPLKGQCGVQQPKEHHTATPHVARYIVPWCTTQNLGCRVQQPTTLRPQRILDQDLFGIRHVHQHDPPGCILVQI